MGSWGKPRHGWPGLESKAGGPPPPPLWILPPGASHPGQPLGVPELPRKRKIDAGAMTEPLASPSGPRGAVVTTGRGEQSPRRKAGGHPRTGPAPGRILAVTFQCWRNPSPPTDLADIEDVPEDNLAEAVLQGRNEVVEVNMES
nr:PREDICTED: LOW QUALITY PROTEIN: uncharacterized protein C9orf40 homolog [Equus przewalskii]